VGSVTVLAATDWPTNADMIADVARLGYLRADWRTLDATFGRGRWWTKWRPRHLVTVDRSKGDPQLRADFRNLPFPAGRFDVVAYDPPYKLNGTPGGEVDERYGVDTPTRWQDRHTLISAGINDCTRVLRPGGMLLVKCQDQVCSGHVRWQTREFADHAEALGLRLIDRLDMLGGREQPEGRRQVHARRNLSSLLVLEAPEVDARAHAGQRDLFVLGGVA
jgi:hypothetical protein